MRAASPELTGQLEVSCPKESPPCNDCLLIQSQGVTSSLASFISSLALVSLIILLGFFSAKQDKTDSSHLKEDKMVLLEPNLSDHGWGTEIFVYPKFCIPMWK